ncbi:MAG: hypothetical protein ACLUYZ_03450 [Lachnospiraceae bacterium]
MRSVLLWKDMDQVAEQMDAAVFQYVGELQTESFEAFADFDLLAFDWYDVRKAGKSGKVLVYIDREDLFFFCRNEAAQQYVQGAVDTLTAGGPLNDQQLLYRFFCGAVQGRHGVSGKAGGPDQRRREHHTGGQGQGRRAPAHRRVAAGAAAPEAVL